MSVSEVHCQCSRVSPGNAGLQPGYRSHAGAWRSQEEGLAQDVRNGHLAGRFCAAQLSVERTLVRGRRGDKKSSYNAEGGIMRKQTLWLSSALWIALATVTSAAA